MNNFDNYYGHKFEIISSGFSLNIRQCNFCKLKAYEYVDVINVLFCLLNLSTVVTITCDEMVIKNIIE